MINKEDIKTYGKEYGKKGKAAITFGTGTAVYTILNNLGVNKFISFVSGTVTAVAADIVINELTADNDVTDNEVNDYFEDDLFEEDYDNDVAEEGVDQVNHIEKIKENLEEIKETAEKLEEITKEEKVADANITLVGKSFPTADAALDYFELRDKLPEVTKLADSGISVQEAVSTVVKKYTEETESKAPTRPKANK